MIPLDVVLPAAASGVLIGLAVGAAWPARPDLAAALHRLDAANFTPGSALSPTAVPGTGSLAEKVGSRLLAETGTSITLPYKDLNLLRISPAAHLGKRVLAAVFGLLAPQLLQGMLLLTGSPFPLSIPVIGSLGLAVMFWLAPGRDVRRDAATARLVVRHSVASYLERVALARIAGSAASQALTRTAEVGDGWIFVRIRQVFDQAELSGVTAWDALKQLGEELDIPELARPADTLALAGDGAAVYTTLQAQARQLRIALLTDTKAEANAASTTMILPVIAGVVLMLVFIIVPITNSILDS
ncbi:type II secretion system F family protein [Streptomyces sp. NBC_01465]|uniref:type II secretion system F family protein n=1 Tax=Streptomyces sp. NBC_01465 TaxID=2903878 RepID=UPI002E30EF3A|nr:type II secretion system F family protein [Streptomyces sp. NBC_01465]